MSEHQLIREQERAHLAKQITENPVWEEAWTALTENLRAHMEAPELSDEVVLEARRGLLILKRVREQIERVVNTGKLAQIELERIRDGRLDG